MAGEILLATGPWPAAPWVDAIRSAEPGRGLQVWPDVTDPAAVSYAFVWKPPEGVFSRLPNLKVIFVSDYAEENVRQDIADNRSVEFLPKPYSLDQINSKVKEVLGKGTVLPD